MLSEFEKFPYKYIITEREKPFSVVQLHYTTIYEDCEHNKKKILSKKHLAHISIFVKLFEQDRKIHFFSSCVHFSMCYFVRKIDISCVLLLCHTPSNGNSFHSCIQKGMESEKFDFQSRGVPNTEVICITKMEYMLFFLK